MTANRFYRHTNRWRRNLQFFFCYYLQVSSAYSGVFYHDIFRFLTVSEGRSLTELVCQLNPQHCRPHKIAPDEPSLPGLSFAQYHWVIYAFWQISILIANSFHLALIWLHPVVTNLQDGRTTNEKRQALDSFQTEDQVGVQVCCALI